MNVLLAGSELFGAYAEQLGNAQRLDASARNEVLGKIARHLLESPRGGFLASHDATHEIVQEVSLGGKSAGYYALAGRTGGYVLVDGKTTLGQLKLYYSNASGNLGVEVKDPLTKRAAILDVGGSPFSQGVSPTPKFRGNGVIRQQLLIGATASGLTLESMNGIGSKGVLEPNSGVLLSYDGQSITVSLNEATGLASLP